MNYHNTLHYLFEQLPMFQQVGQKAFKVGLENIVALDNHLRNPHTRFKSIHIAGTNGKGSTAHGVASILQQAGFKVGLYTSPHYKDFRERIKINGTFISEEAVVAFVEANRSIIEKTQPSFFEWSTALAFYYFDKEAVDFAIIETGLGGGLDATNIITPILSIITNISLDHTHILGNTLEDIAAHKAGIIKRHKPVLIGKYQEAVAFTFLQKAKEQYSFLYYADQNHRYLPSSDLVGDYQKENIATILKATHILQTLNIPISDKHILEGLNNVIPNTNFIGRWQTLQDRPLVITDAAHNIAGLTTIFQQIQLMEYRQLHIVLGLIDKKEVEAIIDLLPSNAYYYIATPQNNRALTVEALLSKMKEKELLVQAFPSIPEALNIAKETAHQRDFIFVGGSSYVVAEVI